MSTGTLSKLVLASGNQGKIKELANQFAPFGIEVIPQSEFDVPEAEEIGLSFVENAIIKARNAAEHSGLPAIADDSGLAVDGLDGAPGIYSARYAGEHATDECNIIKLLATLEAKPDASRNAHFHCTLAFVRHAKDPTPILSQGIWHGRILNEKVGDEGFGYDPVFWLEDLQQSAAQLSKQEKNSISHRGKALSQLFAQLQAQKLISQ